MCVFDGVAHSHVLFWFMVIANVALHNLWNEYQCSNHWILVNFSILAIYESAVITDINPLLLLLLDRFLTQITFYFKQQRDAEITLKRQKFRSSRNSGFMKIYFKK